MGIIKGICLSEKRGTQKSEVPEADLQENWGIKGDAHGGNWHRQISLLSYEKIKEFREKGAEISFGAFGENLIVEGFDFSKFPVGTCFQVGKAELKITQIGKDCHQHCEIFKKMGDCIMPREGVFAVVKKSGHIKVGDVVKLLPETPNQPLTAAVITLSDQGAAGKRKDQSGPIIVEALQKAGYEIIETILLPDDMTAIKKTLIRLSDQRQVNLILTTGGTGFSERDCTPEATLAVATRNAPGIAEAIRAGSMKITPRAMLSREASVIRHRTLIVNLPGSPKAVRECLDIILNQLDHGIRILTHRESECARK